MNLRDLRECEVMAVYFELQFAGIPISGLRLVCAGRLKLCAASRDVRFLNGEPVAGQTHVGHNALGLCSNAVTFCASTCAAIRG